ncbi:ATP-binding protein [Streptomyces coffeae]|uniref:Tetratricopeptide repeat protein n=1 Tax=Streptomyces coffeae TaxID=621382 RepID=A0ABS1NHC7_9ACTN|nr:BTAD domain-containing putative transcriptional regulator [Streptomyces coffeae]MBL1099421.1 tetratricopeptide repeat protein [Streptomyces coffeae]
MEGDKRLGQQGGGAAPGPVGPRPGQEADLALTETRIELELECGRHAEVVSELTALTTTHPLRERLRELLMLALYRGGRRAEALAVHADTQQLLADELGAQPGPALTDLRHRILQDDAELAARTATVDGVAFVRPAQLPASVADFTGRSDVVDALHTRLVSPRRDAPPVLAVAGTGGIGKTALAVHVAHAARRHFPDGQLYADLCGAGPSPAEPEAVLGAFLRALGMPDSAVPDGLEERAALYRSALRGRRVLVLLDNARDSAQVRMLLPEDGESCVTLITSRTRMAGLEGSHLVDLDVMSPSEAFTLFARIAGEERALIEYEATMDVVTSCGFLPLAIRIAASRLAARRTWTVSTLARKLADERRRLDELRAGDLAVKATFELGYKQLEPRQARAFRLLGLVGGPDISLTAAAAALDLGTDETEGLLSSLVDISLLECCVPGRYRFHDLARLYARACAERDERPVSEREAAQSRLLDFYLATAARVYAIERPGDRTVDHLEPTGHAGLTFETSADALDWLFTEGECLISCARRCTGDGVRKRAANLLMAALDLAESGIKSGQYESAAKAISEAAQAAGDERAEGHARLALGHLYHSTGRFGRAEAEMRRALQLGAMVGDAILSCRVPNQRGIIALYQGRHIEAEEHLRQALAAFRADANGPGEASALSNLARVHLNTGRTQAGVELAEQALAIYRRLGTSLRLANGMYVLGIALLRTGRLEESVAQLTEALDIFGKNRQPLWEGMTHIRLAETYLAAGRPALAAEHAERALALGGLGGEWRRGSFLTVLGKALIRVGQRGRARECWREARSIYERLGAPELEETLALLADATPEARTAPEHTLGHRSSLHETYPWLKALSGTDDPSGS